MPEGHCYEEDMKEIQSKPSFEKSIEDALGKPAYQRICCKWGKPCCERDMRGRLYADFLGHAPDISSF